MYDATDHGHGHGHGHGQFCIAATARYVPRTRVRPEVLVREPAATPTSVREAVMQSVYADTLRWRRQATAPVAVDHPSGRATMPARVTSEPRLSLSEMASAVAVEAVRRCPRRTTVHPTRSSYVPTVLNMISRSRARVACTANSDQRACRVRSDRSRACHFPGAAGGNRHDGQRRAHARRADCRG